MFLDIVHYLSLFITYVKSSSGSVSGGSKVGINCFFRSMNIADTLIESESSFSTHEL